MLHNLGSRWQIFFEWRNLKVEIHFSSSPLNSQNLHLHASHHFYYLFGDDSLARRRQNHCMVEKGVHVLSILFFLSLRMDWVNINIKMYTFLRGWLFLFLLTLLLTTIRLSESHWTIYWPRCHDHDTKIIWIPSYNVRFFYFSGFFL